MATQQNYSTTISRFYVDTRRQAALYAGRGNVNGASLPLLTTLPHDVQDKVTAFLRVEDKFMSLASALLKYTFIHRTAKIPWSSIQISRTPKPHGRPYWQPPSSWQGDGYKGLEFNVSHQAGIVILAGCRTPSGPETSEGVDAKTTRVTPDPAQQKQQQIIRIGVDVACAKEPRRTQDLSTQAKLDEWVDTFEEMFSSRERKDMKEKGVPDPAYTAQQHGLSAAALTMDQKTKRFYTYWALKEAYIKMVGEGLLADWLKQLEFVNVVPPDPGERLNGEEIMLQVMFQGKDISESVEAEIEGFEESFIFTMITRDLTEQQKELATWVCLDIEKDIRPCAEGRCSCLQ